MYHLFVGIDISKDSFSVCLVDAQQKPLASFSASMDRDGFSKLWASIHSFCPDPSQVLAGMESTGPYHFNLFAFLTEHHIPTALINPLLIRNYAKRSLRLTKTDPKDAQIIALYLHQEQNQITPLFQRPEYQALRFLAREREQVGEQITRLQNELLGLLQYSFPELERIVNPFSDTMLHFLQKYPSARRIREAKAGVVKRYLLRCGRTISVSAEVFIEQAGHSIGVGMEEWEEGIRRRIGRLLLYRQEMEELETRWERRCSEVMEVEMEILTSVPGIGTMSACAFLSELGDIQRFDSYKQLIAYMGLDPSVYQSGQYVGKSRISKRGNRHLRRWIYIMSLCVIQHNEVFKEYYQKRRKEGMPFRKAVLAVAHKLVRVLFALLKNKSRFHAKNLTPAYS